jgi:aldose 1-epimerase
MTRFLATETMLGTQPVVQLEDAAGGRRVRIARLGAALLNFEADEGGAWFDYADGYRDDAEIVARSGSRFAIMAPFGGRIANARYTFDGQPQDLQPGIVGEARASRHGFVRGATFGLAALAADEQQAQVTLATDVIRPQPGYPHSIDLAVTFTLDAAGLTLEVAMRNVGDSAAPCFFGWHPYFRLADALVDGWELQIPGEGLIRTGADLIALPGAEAYVALDDAPAVDFREPRVIGEQILDQSYNELQPDADGRIRTHLRDPASGRALVVWQEHGLMHAFTSDTISRDVRCAIALEPMECMANAFNRLECADAIRLLPGAERRYRCGVEIAKA